MTKKSDSKSTNPAFRNAKPSRLMIGAARELVRMQLALSNKLHVSDADLNHLRNLPKDSGVILISNHADEVDPRICLELSRLSGKQFISMCNREAFDELSGMAGWALQHLGHFSVNRGAHDSEAKQYAIDVVRGGNDILVIFPEGEIFYLNEKIQPFHSGAVEICMQAILEQRKTVQDWRAYIVPMAIKYHHRGPIENAIEQRIARMELGLSIESAKNDSIISRLHKIQKTLLQQEDLAHNLRLDMEKDLFEQIVTTENAILSEVEKRHPEIKVTSDQLIDQSWQLGAGIRKEIHDIQNETTSKEAASQKAEDLQEELIDLKEVAHLSSWRPDYYEGDVSVDRISEVILKLERELYKIKRPTQLTRRDVHVSISEPIDLSSSIGDYQGDSHAFRHNFTKDLHGKIQEMVDRLIEKCQSQ